MSEKQPINYITESEFWDCFEEVIDEYGGQNNSRWGYHDPTALASSIAERLRRPDRDPDGYFRLSRAQQLIHDSKTGKLIGGANDYLEKVSRRLSQKKQSFHPEEKQE